MPGIFMSGYESTIFTSRTSFDSVTVEQVVVGLSD